MKNIAKILLSVFVILAFTTCKNDIQDQYVGGEGGHLPISDVVIHPLGDEISVRFAAFEDWRIDIKNGGNWCTVKRRSGDKGFNDVTFTVEPFFADQGTSKRTAEVVFSSSKTGAELDSFEVTQSAAYISIAESPEDISFGWDKNYNGNSSNIISVSSSIECKIEIENGDNNQNEWLSVVNVDNNGTLYFGTPGEANNGEFEVTAIDYNFNVANNDATVKIIPVQRNADGSEKTLSDDILKNIVKSISVSQDFLIFTVHEGSISDVTDVINKVLNLDGFSELGYNYLQINDDDTDDKNASKTITIAIEEGYSYVESDLDDASQTYKFEKIGNVSPIDFSGRTVNLQQYEVRILKPNDKLNAEKEILIEMSLSGYDNVEDVPTMQFNLVQEPYIFKLVDGNEEDISDVTFGNAGGESKTYKLKTTGPWSIDDYNQEEWLGLTIEGGKATGVGDAEFTITTKGRNMSFDEDNVATLLFSTGDYFNGDLIKPHKVEMPVKQERFAFDIKVGAGDSSYKDDGRELRLTSSNTKPHRINITSSGDWELFVDDNKWLANDLKQSTGSGDVNFYVWADVNSSETTARTVTLRLVSTLHSNDNTGVWSEEEYTRKLEITQDELHCAIRPKDGGESDFFTRCDMLAYNKDGLSQSFDLDCSVPWIVDSKPEWITLKHDNIEIESGDGMEYLTIDMDVETNKDSSHRSGKVMIKADIDADGEFDEANDRKLEFVVSQDRFVFDVSASSEDTLEYTFGAINTDSIEFTIETTKGAGFTFNDNNDIPDWLVCEEIETGSTEKRDIFKYELKPGHNVETINKSRDCTISIKSDVLGDNSKKEISVEQAAFVFETDKDKLNAFDEMKPAVQSIKVTDCTQNNGKDCYSVVLESDTAHWLNCYPDSRECEFKPNNNTTAETRTGTIKFVIDHSGVPEVDNKVVLMSIPVTQNPYIWDVNVSGSTSISTLGGDSGIKINASGEWTIDCPQGVTATPKEGEGANGGKKADVELTFVPNYGDSEKESKVTVKCKDNDLLKKELTFKQPAYTFKVDGKTSDDDIEYIISVDGGSFEIAIECSDPKAWEAECEDGWVEVTENYTDQKLSIKIEQNKDKTEREAVITISTTDDSDRTVNVTIKQKAAK